MKPAVLASLLVLLAVGDPLAQTAPTLPPSAARPIDFTRDIKPILTTSCIRCHARGKARGGLSIETRDALLKGGDSGPSVLSGQSAESYLISLVAGLDPDEVMPKKGSRLKAEQIGLLRAWIDQGLPWDPAVTFAKAPTLNLQPRMPALPASSGEAANPIDRLLDPYVAAHGVEPARPIDDRQFARRVSFDLIGLPPTPADLRAFLADRTADKRQRLVERLLADRPRYAEHWLSFWNDALRNDYRGTGYIDGGRQPISTWLYNALLTDLPYDRFVSQLVNPVAATEGFTKGIIWRGVVNASQTPPMQAAQNISQVFLGVNLKCASCHDSFINDWQLADAYGLASIYADEPLGMVECDRPTGKTAAMKFLYPELGGIDADAPRAARLAQFADVMTGRRNGRLSRTIVNRLWARLMGRGLVEPVDDMEQPSWSPDLLDWLAEDLVSNGYDLKHTIARIVTSRAYQRAAVDVPERVDDYVFRGPAIRRLSAEQFVDALSAVTGVWQTRPRKEPRLIVSHGQAVDFPARPKDSKQDVPSFYPDVRPARAALVAADPLMLALGRPNREQVQTTRAAAATTLQALELVNGGTLARALKEGAVRLLADKPTRAVLVDRIYRRALGRAATPAEAALCRDLLGPTPRVDGVEDLLWSIVMLPEFQLIS
jgi:mono/diheme cytochrome c family protein